MTRAAFEEHRGRLFGIAYRMLGTVTDAEDVLQEAWLRWNAADRDAVAEPGAYLATVVTRLAIAELTSARARRESYVGPWLPEPVDTSADPLLGAERAEALSLGVLVLLETSEANARQLFSRAKKHLDAARARPATPGERARLRDAFLAAARSGDLAGLEAVLTADVVAMSDGGGKVLAARKTVGGPARVAQFLLGVLDKFGRGITAVPVVVNGEPAMLGRGPTGVPVALWSVDVAGDGIRGVFIVLNPDKLSRFVLSRFAGPSALS